MGEKETYTGTAAKKGEEHGDRDERLTEDDGGAASRTVKGSKSNTSERSAVEDFEKNTEGRAAVPVEDATVPAGGPGEAERAGGTAMNAIRNMK